MSTERYTSVDAIAVEWDALADRAGASPFHRPGWIDAWWRAFGSGTLEVHALRRDGELAAVVPLVRARGGLQAPVNWHTPEFGATAIDADAATALYADVLHERPAYVFLRFVDADDTAPVEAARAAGFHVGVRTLQESPYLPLAGGWDALERPREKELRRYWRKLGEIGELTFELDRDTETLSDGLVIEGSGWKTEEGTAIMSRRDTLAFYTEMARWAESRGILRLFHLRLDNRPIAFELGLEDCGRFYFLKGGYEPEFRPYAPGLVIMREIIHWACDSGLDSFEFLGAPDKVKLDWTQELRRRVAVEAFAPTVAGRVAAVAYERARPLARDLVSRARRARR